MPTSPLPDTVPPVPEFARAHDQLAAHYRTEITEGRYKPGQTFPPVREIAEAWKTSPNTVRRALAVLRDEGLIDYSQGRRVTVLDRNGA